MDIPGEPFGCERNLKNFIRHVPNTIQRKETKNSEKSEREPGMPESEHRRSNDPSFHYMGCSCPLLYDKHWKASRVFDFARSADEMADPTLKPVGKMGFNFRANTRGCRDNQYQTNQEQIPTGNNSCGVEIRRTKDHENLVWGVADRRQECQKTIDKITAGSRFTDPPSLSFGFEWEIEKESRALAIRKLCGDDHIVPSSIMETGTTNRNSCDKDSISRSDATLHELPPNHKSQHTQDVASLLELLKNEYSYHKATSNDVLSDHEIRLLDGIYRITDYRIVLACYNYCFWLEVPDGAIYLWSRLDDSMVRGGDNIKEALTNYLFHRENLRYVDEDSLELIPLDASDEEAEEWAKSPEAYIDVTKLSLKHESEMGGKKKYQKMKKKKKKKKNKNKH